jgi:hypothetical protein
MAFPSLFQRFLLLAELLPQELLCTWPLLQVLAIAFLIYRKTV